MNVSICSVAMEVVFMINRMNASRPRLQAVLLSEPAVVVYMLATIMCLGRGDFGEVVKKASFLKQFKYISGIFANPEQAVSQMLEKAPLAEYLEKGVRKLEQAGIDVDALVD
jgi:hypothetical protein